MTGELSLQCGDNLPFNLEHVVPRARTGPDDEDNMALACRACNVRKSDFQEGVDPESGVVEPLFNPRRDQWDAHFRINLEHGMIIGNSPCDRATIERLQLNSPAQGAARLVWLKIGVFG